MRIIFHLPLDLKQGRNKTGVSGSYLRPLKMHKAFEELGYVVDTVWGRALERKSLVHKIKHNVSQGNKYDFIYSESSTMPTLLTEPNHLPISPYIDFGFFRWAKKNGIPVGLFYRDIHWRFEHYKKQVNCFKRCVSLPFYYLDLILYKLTVDYLFLPNIAMANEIPINWPANRVFALPPGGELLTPDNLLQRVSRLNIPLRLVYVGGIKPPVYDMSIVLKGLERFGPEEYQLTICCREKDWHNCWGQYNLPSNQIVHIVHKHGEALRNLYLNSDIALLLFEPFSYWDFALPLKLFEAISYEVPVLASAGTAVGEFVEKEGVGWVIKPDLDNFQRWLNYILEHPEEIEKKRQIVRERAVYHTWQERAKTVARILSGGPLL